PGLGLIACGPLPVFNQPTLLQEIQHWLFIPDFLTGSPEKRLQLLPAHTGSAQAATPPISLVPLVGADPMIAEQFCLVLTSKFGLVMALAEDEAGILRFQFSFDPQIIQHCLATLTARAKMTAPQQAPLLQQQIQQLGLVTPDYRVVSEFCRAVLQVVTGVDWWMDSPVTSSPRVVKALQTMTEAGDSAATTADIELLQAIAHEVQTPLATIRTLTRSLLKRQDLAPEVLKRLKIVDHECTEQIDRFGLIFRAAELQTEPVKKSRPLATTSLEQVLQGNIPRWQLQASRRNLTLHVKLPNQMPAVVSDPTMLVQALTGLMERLTRHLPGGSHIDLDVSLAGSQLKLQLEAQQVSSSLTSPTGTKTTTDFALNRFKAVGPLLMFQPETGSVSLNLNVTKNLFQAMGGRLVVRERPQQGEILTVFLPVEVPH
ncbi:MAG: HAMP domain-containing sensor histidine kinase, partial [Cyanobacteria bacterium P01_H01_bin.121]